MKQYRVVFAPSMQIATDRQLSFVQVHGWDKEVLYRMNEWDMVLFYATQMTRSNEKRHDAFISVAEVADQPPFSVEDETDEVHGWQRRRKRANFWTVEKELHWEAIEDHLIGRIEPAERETAMNQWSLLLDEEMWEFILNEMNVSKSDPNEISYM